MFSPNKLIVETPKILTSQRYWPVKDIDQSKILTSQRYWPVKDIDQSNILTSQRYWPVTKTIEWGQSLVNSAYFYDNFVTKTKSLFQVSSLFINLLFLKVTSKYNHFKNYWWFSNDFGGWKMKMIFGDYE